MAIYECDKPSATGGTIHRKLDLDANTYTETWPDGWVDAYVPAPGGVWDAVKLADAFSSSCPQVDHGYDPAAGWEALFLNGGLLGHIKWVEPAPAPAWDEHHDHTFVDSMRVHVAHRTAGATKLEVFNAAGSFRGSCEVA